MKKVLSALFFLVVLGFGTHAQDKKLKTYRVGIFAPLYLDATFAPTGDFKYTQNIPKFMQPGLDFIQGAEAGLDSMDLGNVNIIATFYDSKSTTNSIITLIRNRKLDSLDLIIGSVKDLEFKLLADYAYGRRIPFISATYPNDGGVTNNPYLVIVNSTLKAHCAAIYSYLLQNNGTDNIFLIRKKGTQEDKIATYIRQYNEQEGNPLLNIKTYNVDSIVSYDFLVKKLDSTSQNVIIGGSLDEPFGTSLVEACSDLHAQYPITLIGMPNWNSFKIFTNKDAITDFPVYYTSPFYTDQKDQFSQMLLNYYSINYKGAPSEMAFKGFECAYLFTKLLVMYPKDDMIAHLNDKDDKVFSDYNFQPQMLIKGSTLPDYYENEHLYLMKILNTIVSKAW
jgi:substrate-binding family protein